jgi:hypothetical protein
METISFLFFVKCIPLTPSLNPIEKCNRPYIRLLTVDKKAPLPHEQTPAQQEAQRKKDVRGVVLDALF